MCIGIELHACTDTDLGVVAYSSANAGTAMNDSSAGPHSDNQTTKNTDIPKNICKHNNNPCNQFWRCFNIYKHAYIVCTRSTRMYSCIDSSAECSNLSRLYIVLAMCICTLIQSLHTVFISIRLSYTHLSVLHIAKRLDVHGQRSKHSCPNEGVKQC